MNISKEAVIKYIEEKKSERKKSLLGEELSYYELNKQNNIFFGVDMVLRWLDEMTE